MSIATRITGSRLIPRTTRRTLAALVGTVLVTGCVVLPTQVYVADASAGEPVYERCSLTPAIPFGVKVERPGLRAIVSIAGQQGGLVQVQFDIPEGTTVILRDRTIGVDARDGTAMRHAPIASINPVAPARHPETPVIEKRVLPVDTPLQGGRLWIGNRFSDRHYWIATPFEAPPGDDVWITLPELVVDGRSTRFDAIHFVRRLAIGVGKFNC